MYRAHRTVWRLSLSSDQRPGPEAPGSEFSCVPFHHARTRQLTVAGNTACRLSLGTGRHRLELVLARRSWVRRLSRPPARPWVRRVVAAGCPSVCPGLPHRLVLLLRVPARSHDPNLLTSNTVLRQGLKEVEGRCGSVGHGDEFAVPVRVWRPHPPHLPVQGCLDVPTLPPDQRRDVSKKEGDQKSICSTFLE